MLSVKEHWQKEEKWVMGKKNKISSVWKAPGCLDVVIRNKVEYLESGAAVQQADSSSEGQTG